MSHNKKIELIDKIQELTNSYKIRWSQIDMGKYQAYFIDVNMLFEDKRPKSAELDLDIFEQCIHIDCADVGFAKMEELGMAIKASLPRPQSQRTPEDDLQDLLDRLNRT